MKQEEILKISYYLDIALQHLNNVEEINEVKILKNKLLDKVKGKKKVGGQYKEITNKNFMNILKLNINKKITNEEAARMLNVGKSKYQQAKNKYFKENSIVKRPYEYLNYDYIIKLNNMYYIEKSIRQVGETTNKWKWKHRITTNEANAKLYTYYSSHAIKRYYEDLGVKVKLIKVEYKENETN